MLKIKNYSRLLNTYISNNWKVGEIFETATAYLIQLTTTGGTKMQVNLERSQVGSYYELWCWDKQTTIGVANTATPKRIMLKLNDLRDMGALLGTIEFLTRDVRYNYYY